VRESGLDEDGVDEDTGVEAWVAGYGEEGCAGDGARVDAFIGGGLVMRC
jgi:hypothetical protein